MVHFEETPYGFDWGALSVRRTISDGKKGVVILMLSTPKHDWEKLDEIHVYVTRTGKMRFFKRDTELELVEKK